MRSELLDLEYEFDMIDVFVTLSFIAVVYSFVLWAAYMITNTFNYGTMIPFVLLLVFYAVLDEHNDQIKQRNDKRILQVLKMNNFNQLMHVTAIEYLQGGFKKQK